MPDKPAIKKKLTLAEPFWLPAICVLTFICFSHILYNQFLYWDDNAFVSGNPYIRSFSWLNIKYVFTHEFGANWQPLTMLSYMVNYYFSKLSPQGYFFTNLLIHTANTGLVFVFIKKLFGALWNNSQPKQILLISGIVSLWFGIHPMHVESVAWLFERKDVLYTFFYLAGLITYLNFLRTKKSKTLFYVFLLFAASCLSKPMAVVFPLTLLLIDYLLGRNFKWRPLIPFIALAITIGALTLHTQGEEHAFTLSFSLADRFFIAAYCFLAYIYKLFLPIHLSAFYPYPFNPGESLPAIFYACPFIFLLIVGLPLYILRKKNKACFKILIFGYGFYFINIALVLQFFSVGSAIISDRYSYISYIGLFVVIAYFVNETYHRTDAQGKLATQATVIIFTGMLCLLGCRRTFVWQNTGLMLNNVISQYPEKVPQAYKYLGIYYAETGQIQQAYNCYDIMINKMHLRDAGAYCNMGRIYMTMHNDSEALRYLNTSLQIDSTTFTAYEDIGLIYANRGDYKTAFSYYNKAMKIYPYDEGLYQNISNAFMAVKQYGNAVNDYTMLIRLSPDNPLYYFKRGVAEYFMNNLGAALNDFEKTYTMPELPSDKSDNLRARSAYNLSVIYKQQGDNEKASFYARQAQQSGFNNRN